MFIDDDNVRFVQYEEKEVARRTKLSIEKVRRIYQRWQSHIYFQFIILIVVLKNHKTHYFQSGLRFKRKGVFAMSVLKVILRFSTLNWGEKNGADFQYTDQYFVENWINLPYFKQYIFVFNKKLTKTNSFFFKKFW